MTSAAEPSPTPIAPTEPGHHCPCLTESQVRALLSVYPDWDVGSMLYLARAEASLSIGSRRLYYFGALNVNDNGSTDRCGFQINSIHGFDGDLLLTSPSACVAAAYDVWSRQGYGAWSTW